MSRDLINNKDSLSIVIPVYNEIYVIKNVIRDFYEKVVEDNSGVKLIVLEDGSNDGTKEALNKLSKKIPFILISGKDRKGYTRAFKEALDIAKTKWVFFSDSDGQHNPEDIFKLIKETDNNDIIGGYKLPRRDPGYRIAMSKVYNFLIYLLFGFKVKDINSGFKLIKKEVIDNVLKDTTDFKHCVMSEFMLKAYLLGYKIKEVPVEHYARKFGTTNIFSPMKLPRIVGGIINNLFKLKFEYLRIKNK